VRRGNSDVEFENANGCSQPACCVSDYYGRIIAKAPTVIGEKSCLGRLKMGKSLSSRVTLLLGAAFLPLAGASAQTSAGPAPATDTQQPQQSQASGTSGPETAAPIQGQGNTQDEIVVTGQTTRNRTLITASADITFATAADIDRRAPKSTADLLELVPGIFVEGTAGEVSNNYSVRGLQGGGQRFIQLQEDGLPIVFGGGGADEFFSNDITINRLEAVKGGSSGVLGVNGAGATINFISRLPNFDKPESIARFTAYNYGLKRGDFYLSAPINSHLAFNIGGYISSSPGVRNNPFNYDTYRIKAAIEYKMDDGGFIRITGKIGDQKAAFYADEPFSYTNGNVGGIPGLDTQFGNVGGSSFARIAEPVSTFVEPSGYRYFNSTQGIEATTQEIRIDVDKPIGHNIDLFAKAKYLGLRWNFNGLFPGSSTGDAGLATGAKYLTPGAGGPINGLLQQGLVAFPTATQFGAKDLTTGQLFRANSPGFAALNGNGLLEEVALNHAHQSGHEFGSNFGGRWEYKGDSFTNSFTGGVQIYDAGRYQNQAGTSYALGDVRNNSHLYDVIALNGVGAQVGTLTDNGLVSFGNWGQGQSKSTDTDVSVYGNDELTIGKLHVDGGIRWEHDHAANYQGNSLAVNQPVQPGTAGLQQDVGQSFDGTYRNRANDPGEAANHAGISWTVGANYQFTPHLSVYGRYANSFQSNNIDSPLRVQLYEGGVRVQSHYVSGVVTYFHTDFNNQFYNIQNPQNQTKLDNALSDYNADGVEIDFILQPVKFFAIDFESVFQNPKLNNVRGRTTDANGVAVGPYIPMTGFSGHSPERTPKQLFTITPTIKLPHGLGEVYGRYKYIGKIFADTGNAVSFPAYGVTSFGFNINASDRLQVSFNAENVFNTLGLTEGNPRQGQTQNASSGFTYGRGIVGPTYGGSITFRY